MRERRAAARLALTAPPKAWVKKLLSSVGAFSMNARTT